MKSASRDGTWSAALPGVWPGSAMTRGAPGTSMVAPSPNVETTAIFAPPVIPCRSPNQMNRTSGPTRIDPVPRDGFFTSPRASAASASSTWIGTPRSRRMRSAKPMWSECPWVRRTALTSSIDRPIAASSAGRSFQ